MLSNGSRLHTVNGINSSLFSFRSCRLVFRSLFLYLYIWFGIITLNCVDYNSVKHWEDSFTWRHPFDGCISCEKLISSREAAAFAHHRLHQFDFHFVIVEWSIYFNNVEKRKHRPVAGFMLMNGMTIFWRMKNAPIIQQILVMAKWKDCKLNVT